VAPTFTFALLMVCLDLASFTCYKSGIVWPVINAIKIAFQISLPRDRDTLRKLANGFTRFTSVGSYLVVFLQLMLGVQNTKASSIRGWRCNGIP
jgi:hypothetical protein